MSLGSTVRNRNTLLLAVAVLLVFHNLAVSRSLASVLFLVMAFCWLWVGLATFLGRLEDAKAMSLTMSAILIVAALFAYILTMDANGIRHFLFLALLPTLVASLCTYVFITHLQKAGDVTGIDIDAVFEDWRGGQQVAEEGSHLVAPQFAGKMIGDVSHDNGKLPARTMNGPGYDLKAAS